VCVCVFVCVCVCVCVRVCGLDEGTNEHIGFRLGGNLTNIILDKSAAYME
jgi:hypothetical protein